MRKGIDMKLRKFLAVGVILALGVVFGYPFGHSDVAFGRKDAACRYGILLEEAAAVLGVAASDLSQRSFKLPVSPEDQKNKTYEVPPCSYSYRSKSNFFKSIHYTVYVYSRPGKARSVFETMKGNFKTVAKVEAIQGSGDTAFWVNDRRFHRFVVLKGRIMIDVVSPKDLTLQKKVVRILMGK